MQHSANGGDSPEVKIASITARQAIVVAIITAIATVTGTLITVWPKISNSDESVQNIVRDGDPNMGDYHSFDVVGNRVHALVGTWTGTYNQPVGSRGGPVRGDLTLTIDPLKYESEVIVGSGTMEQDLEDGTTAKLNFRMRGGFLYHSFLRLEYENVESTAIQFGSAVVELSSAGETLSGSYVGYGAFSEKVVTGTVRLTK